MRRSLAPILPPEFELRNAAFEIDEIRVNAYSGLCQLGATRIGKR